MTALYQFRAFASWMVRKALLLPRRVFNQLLTGLRFIATAVYHDGASGVFLCAVVSVAGGLVGMIIGGGYEEYIKPEGAVVPFSQVTPYGLLTGTIIASVLFFYTCWHCFKQEQQELINHLKD